MSGWKITLLLIILSAPQAVPAYKLKYFNALTNTTVTITYPMNTEVARTALRFVTHVYREITCEQLTSYPSISIGSPRKLGSGVTFHVGQKSAVKKIWLVLLRLFPSLPRGPEIIMTAWITPLYAGGCIFNACREVTCLHAIKVDWW